jgi:predicted phosphoribosyltransferase
MFRNRTDAAEQLAEVLDKHDLEADIVLAIPRGGLPIGRIVADQLGIPLDVLVSRKIGAPGNAEFAIGAVTSNGGAWLHDSLIERLGVSDTYLDAQIQREQNRAAETAERYRNDRDPLDLDGKRVLIVDDGVATGATMRAGVRAVLDNGAKEVYIGVPVGPPDTIEQLLDGVTEVVTVECPPHFRAVGQFYDSFSQVTDEEAIACLEGRLEGSDTAAQ